MRIIYTLASFLLLYTPSAYAEYEHLAGEARTLMTCVSGSKSYYLEQKVYFYEWKQLLGLLEAQIQAYENAIINMEYETEREINREMNNILASIMLFGVTDYSFRRCLESSLLNGCFSNAVLPSSDTVNKLPHILDNDLLDFNHQTGFPQNLETAIYRVDLLTVAIYMKYPEVAEYLMEDRGRLQNSHGHLLLVKYPRVAVIRVNGEAVRVIDRHYPAELIELNPVSAIAFSNNFPIFESFNSLVGDSESTIMKPSSIPTYTPDVLRYLHNWTTFQRQIEEVFRPTITIAEETGLSNVMDSDIQKAAYTWISAIVKYSTISTFRHEMKEFNMKRNRPIRLAMYAKALEANNLQMLTYFEQDGLPCFRSIVNEYETLELNLFLSAIKGKNFEFALECVLRTQKEKITSDMMDEMIEIASLGKTTQELLEKYTDHQLSILENFIEVMVNALPGEVTHKIKPFSKSYWSDVADGRGTFKIKPTQSPYLTMDFKDYHLDDDSAVQFSEEQINMEEQSGGDNEEQLEGDNDSEKINFIILLNSVRKDINDSIEKKIEEEMTFSGQMKKQPEIEGEEGKEDEDNPGLVSEEPKQQKQHLNLPINLEVNTAEVESSKQMADLDQEAVSEDANTEVEQSSEQAKSSEKEAIDTAKSHEASQSQHTGKSNPKAKPQMAESGSKETKKRANTKKKNLMKDMIVPFTVCFLISGCIAIVVIVIKGNKRNEEKSQLIATKDHVKEYYDSLNDIESNGHNIHPNAPTGVSNPLLEIQGSNGIVTI